MYQRFFALCLLSGTLAACKPPVVNSGSPLAAQSADHPLYNGDTGYFIRNPLQLQWQDNQHLQAVSDNRLLSLSPDGQASVLRPQLVASPVYRLLDWTGGPLTLATMNQSDVDKLNQTPAEAQEHLALIGSDGSASELAQVPMLSLQSAARSPDGQSLLVETGANSTSEAARNLSSAYQLYSPAGAARQLSFPALGDNQVGWPMKVAPASLQWRADGQALFGLYASAGTPFSPFKLLTIKADTLETQLTELQAKNSEYPVALSMSPDGKTLALVENGPGDPSKNTNFYRLSLFKVADGSQIGQLTAEARHDQWSQLQWSPDSRQLSYVAEPGGAIAGNTEIYLLDVATLKQQALTQTPNQRETQPHWSPDGKTLAYTVSETLTSADDLGIYVIPSTGGTARKISGGLDFAKVSAKLEFRQVPNQQASLRYLERPSRLP